MKMIYLTRNTIRNKAEEIVDKKFKSAFRPSQMPITLKCGGYVLLEEADKDEVHPIAKQGSEAHALVEKAVKRGLKERKYIYPKGNPELDCDNLLKDYTNFIYHTYLKSKWGQFGLECFVTSNFYQYLLGGSVDFFYATDHEVVVADLKTGFKPIEQDTFKQLMFYALCIGSALKVDLDHHFHLFAWTRHGKLGHSVKFKELLTFKNEVLKKLKSLEFNVGEHCAKCYRFKHCKMAQTRAESYIQDLKDNPASIEHMKNEKVIRKYFDEVGKFMVEQHEKGKEFEGFKIYKTPGKRFWKNSMKKELMKKEGMTELKLISVREALNKGISVEEGEHYTLNPETKIKYVGGQ